MGHDRGVRILVADDDPRVRSAVRTLLLQEPEPIAIGECSDFVGLAAQVRGFQPNLLLLDWELPGQVADALLFACHGLESRPKVIILSARPELESVALTAGADAFVSKGDPPERLLTAIRKMVRSLTSEETNSARCGV
jgi:DNA-binding NarL/FixJ family response regulator